MDTASRRGIVRLSATVEGRVQGVSFRYYTVERAENLGLTGWVANRPDGRVETVAEGRREELDEFLAFLRQGPPAAYVSNVVVRWLDATGEFSGFGVIRL